MFGDELFSVEPAYRMVQEDASDLGSVFPKSQLTRMKELHPDKEFLPVHIQNQESYFVTSVVHLPFAKDDIISVIEIGRASCRERV